jgi:hypothetical protein
MKKKSNAKYFWIIFLILVIGAVSVYTFYFTLSGEGSPFVAEKMTCEGVTSLDSSSSPYPNSCLSDGVGAYQPYYMKRYSSGWECHDERPNDVGYKGSLTNIITGYVDTIPNCGVYKISYALDVSPADYEDVYDKYQARGLSEVELFVNDISIHHLHSGVVSRTYPDGRIRWVTGYSATEELSPSVVGNGGRVKVSIKADASDTEKCDGNAMYARANSIFITAYECEGDRYFVKTCPLFNNFTIKGLKFSEGYNVSLKDFPSDAYFCDSSPVLIQDANNAVINRDSSFYLTINNQGSVVVPQGEKYVFLFVTKDTSAQLLQKDQLIDELLSNISNLDSTIVSLKLQQADLESLRIKYKNDLDASIIILRNMNLTLQDTLAKIQEYKLTIDQLTVVMNGLAKNLEDKIYWLNYYKSESNYQQELFNKLNESFFNQGIALKNMNLTIEKDAKYIAEATDITGHQAEIIRGLNLNLENMTKLYDELEKNFEELSKDNADYINKIEALKETVNSQNNQVNIRNYLIFGLLLIVGVFFIILFSRKKRRRK